MNNLYKDFDDDVHAAEGHETKKNTFIYESFSDRLKNIKVRLSTNYDNDISFLKMDRGDKTLDYTDDESNFLIMYNREKILNPSPEFSEFSESIRPYIKSYLIMINNADKLIEIFSSTFKTQLSVKNYPFLTSVLDVLTGFIKDIREDAYELFLYTILPNLIELLLNTDNTEVIDKIFAVLVNIFKFFAKVLNNDNNFERFFYIYSELIFNKNKHIRRFANESICFLIKNFEKADLSNRLNIIFHVFKDPAKYFKVEEEVAMVDVEMVDIAVEPLRFNDCLEKEILSQFNDKLIKQFHTFIIDCLSDLIVEILLGVNRNISVKADIFCEKLKQQSDLDNIRNIVMISSFLKLYNKVEKNNKKSIISLFHHYFLLDDSEYSRTFPKLNMEGLNNQLSLVKINQTGGRLYLLFLKELIIKNYTTLDKTTIIYCIQFFSKICKEIGLTKDIKLLLIEILALMMKFYPDTLLNSFNTDDGGSVLEILIGVFKDHVMLRVLLQNLKYLQNFILFLTFSFYNIKRNYRIEANPYYANEEYERGYEEDIVYKVFDAMLNGIDVPKDVMIDIVTTYELLLTNQDELNINKNFSLLLDNKRNSLKLTNSANIDKIISNKVTSAKPSGIQTYINLYSDLLLLSLVKEKVGQLDLKAYLITMMDLIKNHNQSYTGIIDNDLFKLLFNEFNSGSKFYLSSKTSYLQLLEYYLNEYLQYINLDRGLEKDLYNLIIENYTHQHTFQLLNLLKNSLGIMANEISDTEFIQKYSHILLSPSGREKSSFLTYISCFESLSQHNELFTIMYNTLTFEFDVQNDKKHSLNYEILMSRLELVPLEEKTVNLYTVVYCFLLGSYWIRYVKTLWPIITKNMEKFIQLVNSSKNDTKIGLLNFISNTVERLIHLIKDVGNNEDFISRFSKEKINELYFIFNEEDIGVEFRIDNFTHKNIIAINFLNKRDKLLSVSLFYDGLFQSLQSYDKVLTADKNIFLSFMNNVFYRILEGKGIDNNSMSDSNTETYFKCLFGNYISDKEFSTSSLSKKIYENILLIMSSITKNMLTHIDGERLREVLYRYIVISKSQTVQKYIIAILTNLDDRLRNFRKLFEAVVENTNVIDRLYNLEKTTNDSNILMKPEEREALIPLTTRLYYSKYFYITDDTKKLKTRNKINLVSYYIQLKEDEFNDYVNLIFEPLLGVREISENVNLTGINMRIYKKVIEILTLNLKQITGLFGNSINTVTRVVKNILIFIKRLNDYVKANPDYTEYQELVKRDYIDFLPYFDIDGLAGYSKLLLKLIKETKKSSFLLLKTIFIKFVDRHELIAGVTKDICEEYKDILVRFSKSSSPKINALLQFLLSFANKPQLHFIYVYNYSVYNSILSILFNNNIDNVFLNTLLDWVEALLVPYHNKKISDTIEKFEEGIDNPYVEKMILDDDQDEEEDEINQVSDEMRLNNENVLIKQNFNLINKGILELVKNGRVKMTLKDNFTKKVLDIFIYLWNVETLDGIELTISSEILEFIIKLLSDRNIFKSENIDVLTNVLRTAHLLLNVSENKKAYYKQFINMIYKIQDSNNRLLLTLILQEFSDYYGDNKFHHVLELLIYLNSRKKKRVLEDGDIDADVDTILDKMNSITPDTVGQFNLYHLEPLIYQLLVISKSEDYSIHMTSISKIKLIYETVLSHNAVEILLNDKFKEIMAVMYELIMTSKNINLIKNILEVYSHINTIFNSSNEFIDLSNNYEICNDLYSIKIETEGYNFFEAILNLKYDLRIEAITSLREALKEGTLSYFSVSKVILPIFRIYFNPHTFSSKSGFVTYRIETQIEHIISEWISCIPYLSKVITKHDLKDLVFYLFKQIEKVNKLEKQIETSELKKFTDLLYKALSKQLENLQFSYVYDFDADFVKIIRRLLEEIQKNVDIGSQTTWKKRDKADKTPVTNREVLSVAFRELDVVFKDAQEHKEKDDLDMLSLLKGKIYHLLRGMLIDTRVKEKKRFYYIRNYVIKPFFQVVKVMEPFQLKHEIIQLSYELITNLKNREFACREHAREGIRILLDTMGPYISLILFEELKCQLHSGYQRYVMGYTCNYMLTLMNDYHNTDDIRLIINMSVHNVLPILLDELFGEVAEEKEIEQLIKKYREAKTTKAYHSFNIVASRIDFKTGIVHMIYPMKEFLLNRDNDSAVINKANEVLNCMVKGFKNNTTVQFEDVLVVSLSLINMGIDITLKNSKDIREHKKLLVKGNLEREEKAHKDYRQLNEDTFKVQVGAPNGRSYLIEVSGKYLKEKNEIILSNLFTQLGLDIFSISIKKKLFDFEILRSDAVNESDYDIEKISLILEYIITCLKISNNNILTKALKILMSLFDVKLLIIKKNLKKIVSTLFKNLNMVNSSDIDISQTILSAIGDILIKFKFYQLNETQLKILVDFLKLNVNNSHIRPYIFSCLLSVIKKKVIHPAIYDIVNFIQETYITAFEENTITVCQNIVIEFLKTYPLEDNRFTSHVNFFVINLDSSTRKCVINSLKMLNRFVERLDEEKLKGMIDFIILKMLSVLNNTDDNEVKELINYNLDKVFKRLASDKFEVYLNRILEWLGGEGTDSEDRGMKKLALNLLVILTGDNFEGVSARGKEVKELLLHVIGTEIDTFESELESKLEREEYERMSKKNELSKLFKGTNDEGDDNMTVLNVKFDNWDVLYLALNVLEKMIINYPELYKGIANDTELFMKIARSFRHPHSFIKSISLRLMGTILNSTSNFTSFNKKLGNQYIDNKQPVQFLLVNLRYMILNPGVSEQILERVMAVTVYLLVNYIKINQDQVYEFICRLYIESKSYMSNKEIAPVIFERIFILVDQLFEKLDTNELKLFLEPLLSLSYRLISNNSVSDELKNKANIVSLL
jgi:hypothetical protein